mmetsp:Transcript_2421/g.4566  ORF Transcript_2421/g.4566 Transcript_2421/m.4566 type:complete len:635 (-) Transcript_2421:689-2593(-)
MAPKRSLKHTSSPFFAPSTPRKLVQISTPGGTSRLVKKESTSVKESKSSVAGTASNLVNAIIGAGIVGIPFAVKETGLVAGVILVILCAILTEKSLRVLVATAKHVDVPSYETLFESTYGSFGFYFISLNMLIMAYGGCLSYLTIIKDTLPVLLGVDSGDVGMQRAILTVSTLAVILPISMQRDMADLAKTSRISVVFQFLTVLVVVIYSPVSTTLAEQGGLIAIASKSIVKSNTIFIGLGVLSFAFVCQHSAFIVAGSLEHPTKERWATATTRALALCVILEGACGIAGYLAFMEDTEGNVLNNFLSFDGETKNAANVARGLLCTTMFFVYPMDSFVCRHVLVVLFFRGRRAHEGDDAAVLARRDRRVAMTMVIYLSSLIPALMVDNVGSVLAITGTIAGSCLSYIGPGLIYLAVYGEEFLQKVDEFWGYTAEGEDPDSAEDVESSRLLPEQNSSIAEVSTPPSFTQRTFKVVVWYVTLMDLWCAIATMGKSKLKLFKEKEALKSPHINRLGKCAPPSQGLPQRNRGGSWDAAESNKQKLPAVQETLASNQQGPKVLPYGAIQGGNKAIAAALLAKKQSSEQLMEKVGGVGEEAEATDVDIPPSWYDFCYAIFFVVFGMVALCAGLVSILMTD